jgi:hypothetical protein
MCTPTDLECWLFELEHHTFFPYSHFDSPKAFLRSMLTFQTFTNALIHSIGRCNPSTFSFISPLSSTTSTPPSPFSIRPLPASGSKTRPSRTRILAQFHFLTLVHTQNHRPTLSIEAKLPDAATQLEDWRTRA